MEGVQHQQGLKMSGRVTELFRQRKSGVERNNSGRKGSKGSGELPGVNGADAVTDSK